MADGAVRAPAGTHVAAKSAARTRKRFQWRALLRAVHRDAGYAAVGLTFVYALSGLAVNHVADWDPNFHNTTSVHELGAPLPEEDGAASQFVLNRLAIHDTPKEAYREGDEFEILFEHRTLHVGVATGHVVDEAQKPRFILRASNWLHLNRGKKAWKYFADGYAVGLLFLATSGMFMLAGKKGLFGRGIFFVASGVALPIAYVLLSGN
jgi:hypothetical protein